MDIVDFNCGWTKRQPTPEDFELVKSQMKPEKTFLMYQLGYCITAAARHNIFQFIIKFDERVAYVDTDSIKGKFTEEDVAFINEMNQKTIELENKVAAHLGIDPELYAPKTPKGVVKRLGWLDQEPTAITFCTAGAKRYCYTTMDEDGYVEMHTTIAGLPKSAGTALIKHANDMRRDDLVWDCTQSQKSTPYYNDNQPTIRWTDYQGHTYISEDKYGICLLPTSFDLTIKPKYLTFIQYCNGEISYEEAFNDIPNILR